MSILNNRSTCQVNAKKMAVQKMQNWEVCAVLMAVKTTTVNKKDALNKQEKGAIVENMEVQIHIRSVV